MTDHVRLQHQALVGLTILLPDVGAQLADNHHWIALRTLAATCSASKRKQLTSIQVVLPSAQPLLVLTRGVQASLNADTVPLPRISTSDPA
jgi:hypothetical protein